MALLPADLYFSLSQRPPHGFLVNMKLEAVDRRTPSLIRVASVEDVEDHRIKVGSEVLVLSLAPGTVLASLTFPNSLPFAMAKYIEVCESTQCIRWQMASPSAWIQERSKILCCSSSLLCCMLSAWKTSELLLEIY